MRISGEYFSLAKVLIRRPCFRVSKAILQCPHLGLRLNGRSPPTDASGKQRQ